VLFAIGLSVYLWNIYIPVAIPVVATTSVATSVYIVTSILPLLFEHCPYTTASSRLIGSWLKGARAYMRLQYNSVLCLQQETFADYFGPWNRAKRRINRGWPWQKRAREQAKTWATTGMSYLKHHFANAVSHFAQSCTWARNALLPRNSKPATTALVPISIPFADPESLMENGEVPMDLVTSEMIAWLLANCEDPRLTAIVIQSLAGAEPWLPRLPLLENDVLQNLYRYFDGCFESDSQENIFRLKGLVSPDLAALYVRGLNFLVAYHNYEGHYSSAGYKGWNDGKLILEEDPKLRNTWQQQFETGFTALASRRFRGHHRYALVAFQLRLRSC
jgi:hypothetical protein